MSGKHHLRIEAPEPVGINRLQKVQGTKVWVGDNQLAGVKLIDIKAVPDNLWECTIVVFYQMPNAPRPTTESSAPDAEKMSPSELYERGLISSDELIALSAEIAESQESEVFKWMHDHPKVASGHLPRAVPTAPPTDSFNRPVQFDVPVQTYDDHDALIAKAPWDGLHRKFEAHEIAGIMPATIGPFPVDYADWKAGFEAALPNLSPDEVVQWLAAKPVPPMPVGPPCVEVLDDGAKLARWWRGLWPRFKAWIHEETNTPTESTGPGGVSPDRPWPRR